MCLPCHDSEFSPNAKIFVGLDFSVGFSSVQSWEAGIVIYIRPPHLSGANQRWWVTQRRPRAQRPHRPRPPQPRLPQPGLGPLGAGHVLAPLAPSPISRCCQSPGSSLPSGDLSLLKPDPTPPSKKSKSVARGASVRLSRRLHRIPPSDRRPAILPDSTRCSSTTWADATHVAGSNSLSIHAQKSFHVLYLIYNRAHVVKGFQTNSRTFKLTGGPQRVTPLAPRHRPLVPSGAPTIEQL